eukprot:s1972_g2.t1
MAVVESSATLSAPGPEDPAKHLKKVDEEQEDHREVPCLFLPFQHARFLFIYFHANAEDSARLPHTFCTILRDLFQVHVLAVEYPGYGICPGTCDEAGVMSNASAAMAFAIHTLKWPRDG